MSPSQIEPGDLVRVTQASDDYPDGPLPLGAVGVVEEVDESPCYPLKVRFTSPDRIVPLSLDEVEKIPPN